MHRAQESAISDITILQLKKYIYVENIYKGVEILAEDNFILTFLI